jgi:hypothetical protein
MPAKKRGGQRKSADEKATSAMTVRAITVPADFNAHAYLAELMQQLPGFQGTYELTRQLASAGGRKQTRTHSYLDNVRAGRQPVSRFLRRALFCHSIGQFTPPEDLESRESC